MDVSLAGLRGLCSLSEDDAMERTYRNCTSFVARAVIYVWRRSELRLLRGSWPDWRVSLTKTNDGVGLFLCSSRSVNGVKFLTFRRRCTSI
jgi:hypothetical protein